MQLKPLLGLSYILRVCAIIRLLCHAFVASLFFVKFLYTRGLFLAILYE